MTSWGAAKARRVLAGLRRIGWQVKRESGSHRISSGKVGRISCSPSMMVRKSGPAAGPYRQAHGLEAGGPVGQRSNTRLLRAAAQQ